MTEVTEVTPQSVKAHTEYVVLAWKPDMANPEKQSTALGSWLNVGSHVAKSAEAAMAAYAETSGSDETLTLVAVPARYWNPRDWKRETVTRWTA